MKILAALVSRFSRQKDAKPDQFEKRLKTLTAPESPRRPSRAPVSPVLFRRQVGHA